MGASQSKKADGKNSPNDGGEKHNSADSSTPLAPHARNFVEAHRESLSQGPLGHMGLNVFVNREFAAELAKEDAAARDTNANTSANANAGEDGKTLPSHLHFRPDKSLTSTTTR